MLKLSPLVVLTAALACVSPAQAQQCMKQVGLPAVQLAGAMAAMSRLCDNTSEPVIAQQRAKTKERATHNFPCVSASEFDTEFDQSYQKVMARGTAASKAERDKQCAGLKAMGEQLEAAAKAAAKKAR
ncbi:hypothetical protein [Ottowia testudinis]|uniref:PsiF repeat-containing protein n=1 Tax=Ottowia testudinis TaxID=2816950 RepID=A0A975CG54_9BURK|nr:hypothetical protein [Ottowia testudinis]QTD45177.1 hypothetical protein J1M35_19500 [Ottowia testudinis]